MNQSTNQRLFELLSQSVEEYIKSAAPVVSATLAEKSRTHLSSATIRNDLKMLEQLGFMHQIHSSGGRVPTNRGYGAYIAGTHDPTFVADLIKDLHDLTQVIERIDRKLVGSVAFPIRGPDHAHVLERRQNIYRMLDAPDVEMSEFYLIIKERLDGTKR